MDNSRPWQGTLLAIMDIIFTIFAFLGTALFAFMQDFLINMVDASPTAGSPDVVSFLNFISSLGVFAAVIMLALAVLGIFMTIGAFKGQKWSPIVSIIFSVLALVGAATNFDASMIVSAILNALMIYAGWICVKHPFFNR